MCLCKKGHEKSRWLLALGLALGHYKPAGCHTMSPVSGKVGVCCAHESSSNPSQHNGMESSRKRRLIHDPCPFCGLPLQYLLSLPRKVLRTDTCVEVVGTGVYIKSSLLLLLYSSAPQCFILKCPENRELQEICLD
jgi:hypothetical protein